MVYLMPRYNCVVLHIFVKQNDCSPNEWNLCPFQVTYDLKRGEKIRWQSRGWVLINTAGVKPSQGLRYDALAKI